MPNVEFSPAQDCIACLEHIQGEEIRAPCGHYYDVECLTSLFEAATRDESLFHPRCCKKNIPFPRVRNHFTLALQVEFLDKSREYGTSSRVYCALPRCSRFLGSQTEGKGSLKVYKCTCNTLTCARCKNEHITDVGHSCVDNSDEAILTLGKVEGWARCPGCRTMIELNMGCHHMTCLCKVSSA